MGWAEQGPFERHHRHSRGAQRTGCTHPTTQTSAAGWSIPVGDESTQQLKIIDNTPDGLREESLEYVRFVPLLRGTVS